MLRALTWALALTGVATLAYRYGQNKSFSSLDEGSLSEDDMLDRTGRADNVTDLASVSSPNLGERVQDLNIAGAGAGIGSAMSDAGTHDDLLTEASGSDNIKPGLPDFQRGA